MSLDVAPETFLRWLHAASDEVVRLNRNLASTPAARREPVDPGGMFAGVLPRGASDLERLLPEIREALLGSTSLSISPRFFGYIVSSGNQVGTVAELLKGGLNLCPSKWDVSASASEVERCVVRWIAEFIGLPATTAGTLVSGGTLANLTGLIAARTARGGADIGRKGVHGRPPLLAYVSQEGHSCHERSMDLLGLGRDHLVKIPVRDDFTIDCDALERRLEADRRAGGHPFCIIGISGTTNTGAVDDLDRLADLSERFGTWLHVDGAYGAPAARTATAGHLFAGLQRADSVALDPHKWLYAPLEAGCLLLKDPAWLRRSFHVPSDYLRPTEDDTPSFASSPGERLELHDYTLQTTRDFRALKVWLAFRVYGADRILEEIDRNIEIMQHLVRRIEAADDMALLAPAPLSTVCFRYRPPGVAADEASLDHFTVRLRQALEKDGRIVLPGTRIRGREALRACTVNHRATEADIEVLLSVVRELGAEIAGAGAAAPGA